MRMSYRVLAMRSIGRLLTTATLEEVSLAMSEKLDFLHIEGKASQAQLPQPHAEGSEDQSFVQQSRCGFIILSIDDS